jgi:hypothetical protein
VNSYTTFHRQPLESAALRGTILWEAYDEFLAKTETEIKADVFNETGLADSPLSTSNFF